MAGKLLIEIGTEEIPAGYLEEASISFKNNLIEVLESERLEYSEIQRFYTPRRITTIVRELSKEQKKITEVVKGPPEDIAFSEGNPTDAARGFASGVGVSVDSLEVKEFKGKKYVIARVDKESRKASEIIKENIVDVISGIEFPKRMRWESNDFEFARPIRWIVAVLDGKTLGFSVAGVKSGDKSRGHRLLCNKSIEVNAADYIKNLKDSHVIVDQNERKNRLENLISTEAENVNGQAIVSNQLLDEVCNLVEFPFVITGTFDERFLSLPDRVVITAMQSHQRYFPVSRNEELIPYFISVINNKPNEKIKKINEEVLEARLEDAKFYWETDREIPLKERVNLLSGIMWHKSTGTLLDRTDRIVNLSRWLGERTGSVNLDVIEEGAKLAKVDLTTLMIRDGKEFTDLEGYIGAEYGRMEGIDESICKVIEGHYLPRSIGGELPESLESAVVSLADRIDLIVGAFLSGERPTGSRDPLGLRQSFGGFLKIIEYHGFDISIRELVDRTVEEYENNEGIGIIIDEESIEELIVFIKDRIKSYLQMNDIRYDIAAAVLSEKWDNPLITITVAKAMMEFRKDKDEFERLVTGQKRVSNILEDRETGKVNPELLTEREEKDLYEKSLKTEPQLDEKLSEREYMDALHLLKKLCPLIDSLFDNVMVMTEDEKIRDNRLALLDYVRNLFHKIADFEEIVID